MSPGAIRNRSATDVIAVLRGVDHNSCSTPGASGFKNTQVWVTILYDITFMNMVMYADLFHVFLGFLRQLYMALPLPSLWGQGVSRYLPI